MSAKFFDFGSAASERRQYTKSQCSSFAVVYGFDCSFSKVSFFSFKSPRLLREGKVTYRKPVGSHSINLRRAQRRSLWYCTPIDIA